MFVWSKRLVAGLLGAFVLLIGVFFVQGQPETVSGLKIHTTRWMAANYIGLLVWIFVWMFDQARVRGKNVLLWLVPFVLAVAGHFIPLRGVEEATLKVGRLAF